MPDYEVEMLSEIPARLAQARLFNRKEYSKIDPKLPKLLQVLEDVGASDCWHKHGTFFEHLFHVYRVLKMWNVTNAIALCGLFHSSYSNSYVNLAIFEPDVDRQKVRDLIGHDAEELVQWFCIVPRQEFIFEVLMSKYSDAELLQSLHGSKDSQVFAQNGDESAGLSMLVPPEGMVVKHIRTGEDLLVPKRLIAIFLILTLADFTEQWFSWQDEMFGNLDGNLDFSKDEGTALWPGDGKPGLFFTSMSRIGLILNLIMRDEERFECEERKQGREEGLKKRPFSNIVLSVPPILNHCSVIVSPSDQLKAMNLYWAAFSANSHSPGSSKESLTRAVQYNPFASEPHIVLAQVLLLEGKFEEAGEEAAEGLKLLLLWGSQWDKRVSWEAWISWARVLGANARQRTWPKSGFGMINLGLVT